ncbi:MAG TPA: type II toxin-antitoxin system RelE/ParE family toxin [Terracidiphilus sp.]|nr:type II toxin-antitoxin system RelE/ParE family toxin [Terracidiphilus sp.]
MIKSFRHVGVEKFYRTGSKAGIQPHHAARLQRLLTALDAAKGAADLSKPVTYGLHRLKGAEKHWAVWVDANYRLTFDFEGEDAILIDYRDYH